VHRTYNRHACVVEKTDALRQLAAQIEVILHPPTGNVVAIRPKQKKRK
jgi:hypothetical protein